MLSKRRRVMSVILPSSTGTGLRNVGRRLASPTSSGTPVLAHLPSSKRGSSSQRDPSKDLQVLPDRQRQEERLTAPCRVALTWRRS
jgi:hypothetical protein